MKTEKFSKTTSLLLIATLALAMAGTVSAADIVDPSSEYADDTLGLITFFLFFVGYISMGAAFVFFMAERSSVAPQYRTTMTISALIVGIAAFHYYYMRVSTASWRSFHRVPIHGLDHHRSVDGPQVPIPRWQGSHHR